LARNAAALHLVAPTIALFEALALASSERGLWAVSVNILEATIAIARSVELAPVGARPLGLIVRSIG
jgi:hypothetical protein